MPVHVDPNSPESRLMQVLPKLLLQQSEQQARRPTAGACQPLRACCSWYAIWANIGNMGKTVCRLIDAPCIAVCRFGLSVEMSCNLGEVYGVLL